MSLHTQIWLEPVVIFSSGSSSYTLDDIGIDVGIQISTFVTAVIELSCLVIDGGMDQEVVYRFVCRSCDGIDSESLMILDWMWLSFIRCLPEGDVLLVCVEAVFVRIRVGIQRFCCERPGPHWWTSRSRRHRRCGRRRCQRRVAQSRRRQEVGAANV